MSSKEDALGQKDLGNQAYKEGNFQHAVLCFSQAIELDPTNPAFFCNRSLAYASMKDWKLSVADARAALLLNPQYEKAHFRLVKGLLELKEYKDARKFLLLALRDLGNTKDLKKLEAESFAMTGILLRPNPNDFEVIEEIGEGNFTKIFKASLKSTKRIYAIKTIEKSTIKTTRRRHPNVDNEVMMEKRVLHKLDHPNIIELFSTFQDYNTLYYQMEYCEGGEVWDAIRDTGSRWMGSSKGGSFLGDAYTGAYESMALFWFTECVNVLEYMHKRGVVHRDIKPENIMITSTGHVKFVDFGTAKDMIDTDLNGPEFVGTPEYMSPNTLDSKPCGPDADLWSLGCVFYHMLFGKTPFYAQSPYLIFLRTKKANLRLPSHCSPELADMLQMLLKRDPAERFRQATGGSITLEMLNTAGIAKENGLGSDRGLGEETNSSEKTKLDDDVAKSEGQSNAAETETANTAAVEKANKKDVAKRDAAAVSKAYRQINYDTIRDHPLLQSVRINLANQQSDACSKGSTLEEGMKRLDAYPAVRVPLLSEIALRALAAAVLRASDAIASAGGVRSTCAAWVRALDLTKLSARDRARLMWYLQRHSRLHIPGVYRLFFSSAVDARCCRVDAATREYPGYLLETQQRWEAEFFFSVIAAPSFGESTATSSPSLPPPPGEVAQRSAGDCCNEQSSLKSTISAINKLRPRFFVVIGNFVSVPPTDPNHHNLTDAFRKTAARVSDTIPVLFVPGDNDVGACPTDGSLRDFSKRFGADYYGFWYGGLRCLVLNSPLLVSPSKAPDAAACQEKWLEEELEQAKLCATQIAIFSYHKWVCDEVEDADITPGKVVPEEVRNKWLTRMRHSRLRFIFCSDEGKRNYVSELMSFPKSKYPKSDQSEETDDIPERDYRQSDDEEEGDDDEGWTSNKVTGEDMNYEGPLQVGLLPSSKVVESRSERPNPGKPASTIPSITVAFVEEFESYLSHLSVESLPTSATVNELKGRLKSPDRNENANANAPEEELYVPEKHFQE